jgi:2,3-bisphosphoglycerate-dependent phosphoglycerate mutase
LTQTIVYLLRHAQSLPSQEVTERLWPLSERGLQQAHALVEPLNQLGINRVFTSPFQRAIETILPYCSNKDLNFEIIEDLRERKLKERFIVDSWEGLVEQAWNDFSYALPNCESGEVCQTRVMDSITHLANTHSDNTLLISSHGNAIGLYLNKLDSTFGYSQWKAMKNPDLFKIVYTGTSPTWEKDYYI